MVIAPELPETIFAVVNVGGEDERVLTHSTAILKCDWGIEEAVAVGCKSDGSVSGVVRDFFYRVIARNRFRLQKEYWQPGSE